MKIEYVHASKCGNGAKVAEAFKEAMATRGVAVAVHHIQDVKPKELPPADLYVFSSPGCMGKPIRGMRRFLKDLQLPVGTTYAILTTEMAPQPDKEDRVDPHGRRDLQVPAGPPHHERAASGQGPGRGGRGQGLRDRHQGTA